MDVKPGYKQTEVGVIPEAWNIEHLGKLSEFVTSGSRGWAPFYSRSGALFIRSQNVRHGCLDFDDTQYVSPPDGAEGNRTKVRQNDLLITITGNSVGNVALVNHPFDEAYISQHVGLVRFKEIDQASYICCYLSPNSPGNSQIAGSQSGQSKPGLNLQNLRDFRIALPPTLYEQRAIAEALSDVDNLLGGLDRLIAKKRDLKQAALQQLLTGRTRLPGFRGEWETKRLGSIATCFSGGTPPTEVAAYYSGDIQWITSGDLNSGYITHVEGRISAAGLTNSSAKMIEANSLLIALYGATSGVTAVSKISAAINQAVLAIIPKSDNVAFLYFKLTSLKDRLISTYTQGGQPNLSGDIVKSIELRLPPVPEQTAIAEVLTDMDAELSALEQRRDKTRALKQAMMQELLTGKTRLI